MLQENEKTLNVRMDIQTKNKLKELATFENRTVSSYIKNLIVKEYTKQKRKEAK